MALEHVSRLKRWFRIQEVPEESFLGIYPYTNPAVIIHPYFWCIRKDHERFVRLRPRYRSVIAVDVADSDRLSDMAVNMANLADAVVVPSTWARAAFIRSGVSPPVYVVPHGLHPEFYRPKRPSTNSVVVALREIKARYRVKYCLFFLWHSSRRKGADLVYKVMKRIQEERDDVVLVLKVARHYEPIVKYLARLRTLIVRGWMSISDLVDLYDTCDVYLLFSRGGGFELNGLEALARGLIVIAPEEGAWVDYLPKESLVKVAGYEPPLVGNPFHVGNGPVIDVEAAVDRLHEVLDDLDEWKARYAIYADEARRKFTWDRTAELLASVISRHC